MVGLFIWMDALFIQKQKTTCYLKNGIIRSHLVFTARHGQKVVIITDMQYAKLTTKSLPFSLSKPRLITEAEREICKDPYYYWHFKQENISLSYSLLEFS